jgi:hypothetical protein
MSAGNKTDMGEIAAVARLFCGVVFVYPDKSSFSGVFSLSMNSCFA